MSCFTPCCLVSIDRCVVVILELDYHISLVVKLKMLEMKYPTFYYFLSGAEKYEKELITILNI